MKYIVLLMITLFTAVSVSGASKVMDDETDSSTNLTLGLIVSRYNGADGYKPLLFYPGGELLVNFHPTSKGFFSTGLNYQIGSSKESNWQRVIFGELSLPLIYTRRINDRFHLSAGLFGGAYVHYKLQSTSGLAFWYEGWRDVVKGNDSDLFADAYFAFGKRINSRNNYFMFDVFARYRLNDTWINNYITRFMVGIKIRYSLW